MYFRILQKQVQIKLGTYLKHDKGLFNIFTNVIITIFRLLLFIHYLSCGMLYIGTSYSESWLAKQDTDDKYHLYIASYYFITTTLTTVGYGDLLPFNNSELIFMMLIQLIGIISVSIIMGQVRLLLEKQKQVKDYFKNREEDIEIWLFKLSLVQNDLNLPSVLRD